LKYQQLISFKKPMTPIELLAAVPLIAFFSFIWGALQTEEVNAKAYRQDKSNQWIETRTASRNTPICFNLFYQMRLTNKLIAGSKDFY
jgi:hypothetical protein